MNLTFNSHNITFWLILFLLFISLVIIGYLYFKTDKPDSTQVLKMLADNQTQQSQWQLTQLQQLAAHQQEQLTKLREFTKNALYEQQSNLIDRQNLQSAQLRQELNQQLNLQREHLSREVASLTQTTEKHLNHISAQVDL